MNIAHFPSSRAISILGLSVFLVLGACEASDTESTGGEPGAPVEDTNVGGDATGSEDVAPTPDASVSPDGGPVDPLEDGTHTEPDAPVLGCVDDSGCDDFDPCTLNVCDASTGLCSFPTDENSTDPACTGQTGDCGDGVCDGHETKDTCPADCDDGTGPPPGDGSCAGKCGEYDANASCQCDTSCVTYGDCCADYDSLCTCDPANPPSCLSDADCGACNESGDACLGTFTCQGGVCTQGEAVVCDTSGDTECLKTLCDSWTGECVQNADASVCDDADYCTEDICDAAGACVFEAIETCGENYACEMSEAPTSNDDTINACVCDGVGAGDDYSGDPYCCENAWDSLCVSQAQAYCGVNCNCEELAEEASPVLACESDEDCGWCNPENPCDGAWACVANVCTQQDKVVCDASGDTECMKNTCNPEDLHCEMVEDLSLCDDEDPCTLDSCSAEGACVHEAGCGTNHPCATSDFPQSKDETINACVCEGVGASDGFTGDSYCCENAWDSICVSEAAANCGAVCDCTDPSFDPNCSDDSDCVFCSEDVCTANWSCVEGTCADTGPLVCDATDDAGCIQNTCDTFAAGCAVVPSIEACDDDDPCTWDFCDGETGACSNEVIEGCAGEPPFECLGGSEPAAQGCDAVATFEGCCDPWGRVLWCGQDENGEDVTYCEDCAGAPYCGWSSSWYWCGIEEPGQASPDESFPLQCPGLNYADE